MCRLQASVWFSHITGNPGNPRYVARTEPLIALMDSPRGCWWKRRPPSNTPIIVFYQMRRKTPSFRAEISGADPGGVNPVFPVARCIA